MADFAKWCRAIEISAKWEAGSVLGTNLTNRKQVAVDALDDPFTAAVLHFAREAPGGLWEKTPTELLVELQKSTPPEIMGQRWPKHPEQIGTRLRQVSPVLRDHGVEVTFYRSTSHRFIRLSVATSTNR
jgi:hypothetical protein